MNAEEIYQRINKTPNGCWEATVGLEKNGYARWYPNGWKSKRDGAHRISFMIFNGPIKEGNLICHSCDNPRCVNPAHLFQGSASDNLTDCFKKGRGPAAKLSFSQVREIRKKISAGGGMRALAREYKVSHPTIIEIKKGGRFTYVK